jgi:hypothetical protein
MLHQVITLFVQSGGPYLYLRLVMAASAVCAVGRLIPVKRKQVPGYRRRVLAAAWTSGSARHRARPGRQSYPPSPQPSRAPAAGPDSALTAIHRAASVRGRHTAAHGALAQDRWELPKEHLPRAVRA